MRIKARRARVERVERQLNAFTLAEMDTVRKIVVSLLFFLILFLVYARLRGTHAVDTRYTTRKLSVFVHSVAKNTTYVYRMIQKNSIYIKTAVEQKS